ncbi:MAG: hypothetical protein AAGC78_06530 [Cellvibrio sp.]|uniref:hypothetical protein n=1 Tax=Cellvibrio sp. TaxID=1965322 RepID=UPI0031A23EF1
MTSKKDENYQQSNPAKSGPAERMTGGDLTDDIEINDSCAPYKKSKHCGKEPDINSPRPREAELKDTP